LIDGGEIMDNIEWASPDINAVAGKILSEGTMPRTQGDERRRELVQAAYHLIAEGGFEGLRTRNVAAQAGVNIATLHYYFARKEDLIQGVVEYLLQQFMMAYLPGSPFEMRTPLEKIHGELAELQHLLQEKPDTFIVFNELVLRSLHDPTIQHMLKWLDQGWHAYLVQVIHDGREQGLFRADLDPDSTATWLILLNKGTAVHWMTNPGSVDFDRIRADVEHWLTN
jgi:AcrR family transcriptional regulator